MHLCVCVCRCVDWFKQSVSPRVRVHPKWFSISWQRKSPRVKMLCLYVPVWVCVWRQKRTKSCACVCVYLSLCVPTFPQRVVWYCSGSVRVKMAKLLQRQRAARLMGMNEISAACTMPQQTESRQHKKGESAPLLFSSDRIISVHLSLIELTLLQPHCTLCLCGIQRLRHFTMPTKTFTHSHKIWNS